MIGKPLIVLGKYILLAITVLVYFLPILIISILAIFWALLTGNDLTRSKPTQLFIAPLLFIEKWAEIKNRS